MYLELINGEIEAYTAIAYTGAAIMDSHYKSAGH